MSLNQQLEDVRKEIGAWKRLKSDPQYQKLMYGMREQVRARQAGHYGLLARSLDDLIILGSVNSEIAGIEVVLKYPDVMLAELEAQEKLILEQINESQKDRI